MSGITFDFSGYVEKPNDRRPETNNLMLNTYFRFNMTKVPFVTYFCQRVNVQSFGLEAIEQPTSYGARIFKAEDAYNYEDLQIEFIVDENMKNWVERHDWLRTCANLKDRKEFESRDVHSTNAELVILNSAYNPIKVVEFTNIIPTSIGQIQFDSTTTDPEPISTTATFRFDYYDVVDPN